MVKETINYYKSLNTNIFCCLSDCTKASGQISFHNVFSKLFTAILPGVIKLGQMPTSKVGESTNTQQKQNLN